MDRLRARARARAARVVFPEAAEPRVRDAMARLAAEGLCVPVGLAEAASEGQVAALMRERGMAAPMARRLLRKPLMRAAAMVAAGEADAMVAGADAPTRRVIEAAAMCVGLAPGVAAPSSFFLMRLADGRDMIWADCAVTVAPDAAGLASIARASAASAEALLGRAAVALLSYATGASGAGPSVDAVRAAAEATGFAGPVQADAALDAGVAARKGVALGEVNVLVFPSLDAGNIAYKLAARLAGAAAVGPMLQGFRRPVCDLSRGATVAEIVDSAVVASAMA